MGAGGGDESGVGGPGGGGLLKVENGVNVSCLGISAIEYPLKKGYHGTPRGKAASIPPRPLMLYLMRSSLMMERDREK